MASKAWNQLVSQTMTRKGFQPSPIYFGKGPVEGSPPVEGHTSAREGGLTASVGASHTGRGSESKLSAVKLKPYWCMLLRADSKRG